MREIVLDVETTGLDPIQGHRIVELGCVELLNRIPTGRPFSVYLNPDRDMPAEAFAVHGLSTEFYNNTDVSSKLRMNSLPSLATHRWSSTMPASIMDFSARN